MVTSRRFSIGLAAGLLAWAGGPDLGALPAAEGPSYDAPVWHEYAKGVYGFETVWMNSIVLLGEEGVLVMDTYDPLHARALKREIDRRFALPVQYVVYSHAHADHLRGADLFADTAAFIAQERQVPRLEFLSRYEPSIVMPQVTFDEEYRLRFGGREVVLKDYGPNHATGVTVMHLPDDGLIAAFDIVYPKRLLWYTLNDYSPRGILNSLRRIYETEFELCITAHGRPATRAEFKEFTDYMDDLVTQVGAVIARDAHIKGPVEALAAALREVDLSKYADWGFYDEWREGNIEGVFQSLFVGF